MPNPHLAALALAAITLTACAGAPPDRSTCAAGWTDERALCISGGRWMVHLQPDGRVAGAERWTITPGATVEAAR